MLFLFYGNNRERILTRSKEIVESVVKKSPDALYFNFTESNFERAKLDELTGGRSLFSQKIIVLCDGLLENPEIAELVSFKISEMSSSNSLFVFREGVLRKSLLEIFKKSAAIIAEFSVDENTKRGYMGTREVKLRVGYENFNIFSFTDALGSRDRKLSWVLFHKALRAGIPAEELFWKAVWIFRNMILADISPVYQKELTTRLKISPFVVRKSRGFLKNYSIETRKDVYGKLVRMYHEFRRGTIETEIAMEQFILNL